MQSYFNGKVGNIGELDYHRGRWPITISMKRGELLPSGGKKATANAGDEAEVTRIISVKRQNLTYHGCASCGQLAPLMCGKCVSVRYCSVDCQRAHFVEHKNVCRRRNKEAAIVGTTGGEVLGPAADTQQTKPCASSSQNDAFVTVLGVNGSGNERAWSDMSVMSVLTKGDVKCQPGHVKSQGLSSRRPDCFRIVVKVQVPIGRRGGIFCYNKDRSFSLLINPPEAAVDPNPHWEELHAFVQENGLSGGVKIYLYCDYNPNTNTGYFPLTADSVVSAGKLTNF